jgi:hypothetical protein
VEFREAKIGMNDVLFCTVYEAMKLTGEPPWIGVIDLSFPVLATNHNWSFLASSPGGSDGEVALYRNSDRGDFETGRRTHGSLGDLTPVEYAQTARNSTLELTLVRRPEGAKACLVESRQDVREPHMQNMVIHDDVSVTFVMQVHVVRSIDRRENWKCGAKKIKKIRNGGSLERVQAPMIQFQHNDGSIIGKRFLRSTQHVTFKSFNIDLYEV